MRQFRPQPKVESVCVCDYAGTSYEDGCWADWCPMEKIVVFGGSWTDVPNWKQETQPEPEDVLYYANYFLELGEVPEEEVLEYTTPLFDWREKI